MAKPESSVCPRFWMSPGLPESFLWQGVKASTDGVVVQMNKKARLPRRLPLSEPRKNASTRRLAQARRRCGNLASLVTPFPRVHDKKELVACLCQLGDL